MKPKRQIAVAVVKGSNGLTQRIELFTIADAMHVFALAMGYKPGIAFSLGVVSRSAPGAQSGESDLTLEFAKKVMDIARLINGCRETHQMPEMTEQVEAILAVTSQVHKVEGIYTELCQSVPGTEATFSEQYNTWIRQQEKRSRPPTVLSRIRNFFSDL